MYLNNVSSALIVVVADLVQELEDINVTGDRLAIEINLNRNTYFEVDGEVCWHVGALRGSTVRVHSSLGEVSSGSSRTPAPREQCTRLSSIDQGASGVELTGMLFSAAYFSTSARPWNLLKNSASLQGGDDLELEVQCGESQLEAGVETVAL